MHNNVITAGSRDRQPMLATGRYAQWQSRFLRYIDTRPNGDSLRKCILKGPYQLTTVTIPAVPATKNSPVRDKDMQKILALIAKYFKKIYKPTTNNLITSSNFINKNVDTTIRKPKSVKDSKYHKEKMLLCKQAEKGVPLQVEQSDWLANTDEEIDEQELEAHYNYMAKIQEVPTADSGTDTVPLEQVHNDVGYSVFANLRQHLAQPESTNNTCLVEKDDSNVTHDSPNMCDNDIQTDQNAEDELVALANFILNLKLDNIAISELKKLNEKSKGKYVETKFDKPYVVRQPNAQRIQKPSVLGKPAPFSDSLERKRPRSPTIKASNYDNSGPVPQLQNVSPSADTTVPSQQELDLLFGPLYDEFFNAGTSSVNKSSSSTDNSKQQDTPPTTNMQSSTEPINPKNVNAEENNDTRAENTQFHQDEFINPFCTLVREIAESSLCDILVSWISKKQDCTAMSSGEAEYVALSTSYAQYLVRRIGMRCLTLAELEVIANESA
nr:hypothetical protein [Tanacetum cinerariifolium]